MEQQIVQKLLDIQDRLITDPQYQSLMPEYRQRNTQLLAALETMEPEQKDAVLDFLGIALEMHLRMLELACQ